METNWEPRVTPGADPRWADYEYAPGRSIAVPVNATPSERDAIVKDTLATVARLRDDSLRRMGEL